MKNRFWILIALFLSTGMLLSAQGFKISGSGGLGYQLNMTKISKDTDWNMAHGIRFLARVGFVPIGDDKSFGIIFSGYITFPGETNWVNPDTKKATKITDASMYDVGILFGPSLQGKITGPLGFGIAAGIFMNITTINKENLSMYFWPHGTDDNVSLEYSTWDLGPGLNAGLNFKFSDMFFVELGSDFSYSLWERDSYSYHTSKYKDYVGTNGTFDAKDVTGKVSKIRVSPYVIFGAKF